MIGNRAHKCSRLHSSLTILKTLHEIVLVRLKVDRRAELDEVILNELARETKLRLSECSEILGSLKTIGVTLRVVSATDVLMGTRATPFSIALRRCSRGRGTRRVRGSGTVVREEGARKRFTNCGLEAPARIVIAIFLLVSCGMVIQL